MDEDLSASWAVKFAEIDPLPGAEQHRTVFYQNLLAAADNGALDVGVGIAFDVPVSRPMLRDKLSEGQQ